MNWVLLSILYRYEMGTERIDTSVSSFVSRNDNKHANNSALPFIFCYITLKTPLKISNGVSSMSVS